MKVLFVCEANMMRSQMGEAFYNQLTGTGDATSAGVVANVGHPVPSAIVEAMREKGISMGGMVSKQLSRDMVDAADAIVAFPTPYMPRELLDNPKTLRWDVSDPHYIADSDTNYVDRARDRIEERIKSELL